MPNLLSRRRLSFEPLEQRLQLALLPGTQIIENHDVVAGVSWQDAMTPAQLSRAHGIDQAFFGGIKGDGTGQTVAIVAFGVADTVNLASDVAEFNRQFGLPSVDLKVVNSTGGTTFPKADKIGVLAAAANIQTVHAAAPGAKILVVVAAGVQMGDFLIANNYARRQPGVSVVLHTWSSPEKAVESALDSQYFANSSGVTYVAAGRDNGGVGVLTSYPAISPYVLSVGGTAMTYALDGTWQSESAWRGSAGGSSLNGWEKRPAYQASLPNAGWGGRQMPDVSANAAPINGYAVYSTGAGNSGWHAVGGSGQAAAIWAGTVAIINQSRVWAGNGPIDGPTELLPKIYGQYKSSLRDITTGSNTVYLAKAGYDMATGVGSLRADQLVTTSYSAAPNNRVPVPTVFSTGVKKNSAAGTASSLIPSGSVDSHYRILTSPTSLQATSAYVTLTGTYPFTGPSAAWAANNEWSQWISPQANENSLGGAPKDPVGTFVYRTNFDLTGFDPTTILISGRIYTDNNLAAVELNGVQTGISSGGFNGSPFTISSGFQPGRNTFRFHVVNLYGEHANPSGLRVQMVGTGIRLSSGTVASGVAATQESQHEASSPVVSSSSNSLAEVAEEGIGRRVSIQNNPHDELSLLVTNLFEKPVALVMPIAAQKTATEAIAEVFGAWPNEREDFLDGYFDDILRLPI